MPLEELSQTVDHLLKVIQAHSAALSQSAMLTRYALVDPLLRGLGWDTGDPDQIRPHDPSDIGGSDYTLHHDGKPVMMVEARELGTQLEAKRSEGMQLCLKEGTPYFAITDGRRWEIFDLRTVPNDENPLVTIDIAGSKSDVILNVLVLWRPNVKAGEIALAREPIATHIPPSDHMTVSAEATPSTVLDSTQAPREFAVVRARLVRVEGRQGQSDTLDVRESAILAEPKLTVGAGRIRTLGSHYTGASIHRFKFMETNRYVDTWKGLLVSLVTLVYESHQADFPRLIVAWRGSKRIYCVNEPSALTRPMQVGNSQYYVETHMSAEMIVKESYRLIEIFGHADQDLEISYRHGTLSL